MKYLKVATTLLLLLGLVANLTFAGGVKTAGSLPLPMRESDQLVKMTKHVPVQAREVVKEEPSQLVKQALLKKTVRHTAVLTKTNRQVPPEILSGGFHGTWQIGTGHAFTKIADIAFLLNIVKSVDGPVVFELTDASYTETEPIAIGPTDGISAVNNVIIRLAAGNASTTITVPDDSANGGGIRLNDVKYLTIDGGVNRGITIHMTGYPIFDTYESPIRGFNLDHVTITGCNIVGAQYNSVWTNGNASVMIAADSGKYNTDVTIDNCNLSGGHYGVASFGNYLLDADHYGVQDRSITVTNNYIHDVTEMGILLQQVTYAHVAGNTVSRVVLGSAAGASPNLYFTPGVGPSFGGDYFANMPLLYRVSGITVWGDHAVIANNAVDSVYNNRTSAGTFGAQAFGIRVIGFGQNDPDPEFGGGLSMAGVVTGTMVKNNIVTRIYSKAVQNNSLLWHEVGIKMEAGRWDTLVHNTVYLSGAENGTNPGSCAGLIIEGTTTTPPSIFGGSAGFPGWTLGQASPTGIFSYRLISKDNVFAIDRTGTTGINVCMGIQNVTSSGGYVSDYRPPSDNNVLYMGALGSIAKTSKGDNWVSLYDFQNGYASLPVDNHSQADDPTFVSVNNAHINPAGFSSADGNGVAYPGISTDFYGVTRGTPPDIGAVEGTGAGQPHDLRALNIMNPGPAGTPQGLPFSGFKFRSLNLTANLETGVPVSINITGPGTPFSASTTFTAHASGLDTVVVPGTWTPDASGDWTMVLTVDLGTDVNLKNDTLRLTVPVAAIVSTLPYNTGFETAGDRSGWFGDGDFVVGSTSGGNTKLGGAHGGDKAYVTKTGAPTDPAHEFTLGSGQATPTVYSAATASHLYTPYFNLTGVTSATISLYHSIQTEPGWDQSVVEYTIDTGKTWKVLGILNDPNGINWYSTVVYPNAVTHWQRDTCFDTSTAKGQAYPAEDPGHPSRCWSSSGECGVTGDETWPQGPNGYILVALNLTGHETMNKPLVRFRYTAFSDAVQRYDGWAIDDFQLGTAPTTSTAALTGTLFLDSDGNGTDNSEPPRAGVIVGLDYFGAPTGQKDTTDVNGAYSFTMQLPGLYTLHLPTENYAFSEPAAAVNYAGTGTPATVNVGYFVGSISGKVYDDHNDNGVDNTEAGLSGWTVEVHKDSVKGALYTSVTSGVNGAYTAYVPNGTWVVRTIIDSANYRQTQPATVYTVTTSGNSSSPTAVVSGYDFGNFVKAHLTVLFATDGNGDGLFNETLVKMPGGKQGNFIIATAAGHVIKEDSLGNLVSTDFTVTGIDTGSYIVYSTKFSAPVLAEYLYTNPTDTFRIHVTTGGLIDTSKYLFFKYAAIDGNAYADVNGNGKKEGGDNNLIGYTVNLTGAGAATTATDSSGNYHFTGVLPGAHTVTLTLPPGSYTFTKGNGGYTTTGFASNQAVHDTFAVFTNVSIAGTVYRDRNNNGALDGLDNGIVATVWLKKVLNAVTTYTSTTSASDGSFSFADLGPGAYTDTVEFPVGYGQTQPLSGGYSYTAVSGGTHTGDVFGFFQLTDNTKYQTINMATLLAAWNSKPGDHTKTGVKGTPTVANLLNELVAAPITVGILPGPALQPKKYTDIWKTLKNKGGATQSALPAGGFDFDVKHKLLSAKKPYASMDPGKINNALIGNLLLLNINVIMSENGNTASNFGSLVINNGGMFQGLSINALVDTASYLMTNWQKVPQTTYDEINTLAEGINNAFAVSFHYDATQWASTGKIVFNMVDSGATVYTTSFLKPATSVAPRNGRGGGVVPPDVMPTVYALYQNYPNPFNPTTNIRFDLPMQSIVTVKIYNMLGQEIATLNDHELMDAGQTEVAFDANAIASGVYFYRVVAEGSNDNGLANGNTFTKIMKMVLVK